MLSVMCSFRPTGSVPLSPGAASAPRLKGLTPNTLPVPSGARFPTGVELFGTKLPMGAEIAITAAFGVVFLVVAMRGFNHTD